MRFFYPILAGQVLWWFIGFPIVLGSHWGILGAIPVGFICGFTGSFLWGRYMR